MGVDVSAQQHGLKKKQTGRPYAWPAAEPRQNIFTQQGLHREEKESTREDGKSERSHAGGVFGRQGRTIPVRRRDNELNESKIRPTCGWLGGRPDGASNAASCLLSYAERAPVRRRIVRSHPANQLEEAIPRTRFGIDGSRDSPDSTRAAIPRNSLKRADRRARPRVTMHAAVLML